MKKFSVKSFWPLLLIFLVAGILKVKTVLDNPKVPTATVPTVTLEDLEKPVETPVAPVPDVEPTPSPIPPSTPVKPASPAEFNLAVPFISQAPFGVWDPFHEETCEEASFYMVAEFYNGNTAEVLDAQTADDLYKKVVDAETANGLGLSITAAESVEVINESFGYKAFVVENPTVEQIKEFVRNGQPVIMPAAGRKLGNPFFSGEGPLYHMLVIRGYTKDGQFITNDPGTRHGQNYTYAASVIMDAMGDWNNGDPVNGAKRIIVMEPK